MKCIEAGNIYVLHNKQRITHNLLFLVKNGYKKISPANAFKNVFKDKIFARNRMIYVDCC